MRRLILLWILIGVGSPSMLADQGVITNARFRRPATAEELSGGGGGPAAPIAITELLSEGATSNGVSYVSSGTFSVASNRLGLCWVVNTDGAGDGGPNEPESLTQTGQTWVKIGTRITPSNELRITLFRTLGAGAAAAAVTAAFPLGDNQTGVAFLCADAANVDTSGSEGSGAVLQAVSIGSDDDSSINEIVLGARSPSTTVLLGAGVAQNCTWTPEGGYTEGTKATYLTPPTDAQFTYVIGGSDTSPSITLSSCTPNGYAAFAVEIKPALTGETGSPTVAIALPTAAETYETTTAAGFAFSGTAADNVGVSSVTWECTTGVCMPDSGTADGTTAWSVTGVTLPCDVNGELTIIIVTATDAAMNTGMDVLSVTCTVPDTVAPTIQITSPTTAPTHAVANAQATIGGVAADENALAMADPITWACATCTPASGAATGSTSWTFNTALTCSGGGTANTITVTATDVAMNTAQDEIVITCTSGDVTPPTVTITTNGGANFTAATSPQTLQGTSTEVGSCAWSRAGAGGALSGSTSWSGSVTLVSGANLITVTCLDAAGNPGTDTITITLSAAVQITTTACPPPTVGTSYANGCTMNASGGTTPYTWSALGTTLATDPECDGLTFIDSGNQGIFGGTPTTAGVCGPVTIQVSDAGAVTDTQDITLIVNVMGGSEGPHDYFNTLNSLGYDNFVDAGSDGSPREHSWGLRDQGQINALDSCTEASTPFPCTPDNNFFTYDFAGDTYVDKQDAAKYFKDKDIPASTTVAKGPVNFFGTDTTVVPVGAVLTRPSDGHTYVTVQSGTITDGVVRLSVESTGVGPDEEVAGNTVFSHAIAGVTSAVATATGLKLEGGDAMPGNHQLDFPIQIRYDSGDTLLIIWDWYFGQEFAICHGDINNYKQFNVRNGGGGSKGGIHIGIKFGFNLATPDTIEVAGQFNSISPASGDLVPGLPTGLRRADTIIPTGAQPQYPQSLGWRANWGVWTRLIVEVRLNVLGTDPVFDAWKALDRDGVDVADAPGEQISYTDPDYADFNTKRWSDISLWALDENRNATSLLRHMPAVWGRPTDTHLTNFEYEFATSTHPNAQTCDLIGYGRNVIVLRNYATNVSENDTTIFKKPVR